jgi:hypothetical protein
MTAMPGGRVLDRAVVDFDEWLPDWVDPINYLGWKKRRASDPGACGHVVTRMWRHACAILA